MLGRIAGMAAVDVGRVRGVVPWGGVFFPLTFVIWCVLWVYNEVTRDMPALSFSVIMDGLATSGKNSDCELNEVYETSSALVVDYDE